jgi:long-chain acyl-CoA synthetase
MTDMTTMERSQTPANISAERAAVEADVAGSTLLTAYAETVTANGGTEAHRWQDDSGNWHSLTYRQVHDQVRDLTLGLGAIGFQPGEFAVIWSGNRSEATVADYAVMHARGVPVFIYNTVTAEQAAYIAGHCEATVAILEAKYLPTLLEVRGQLPKLREIILIDDSSGAHGTRSLADVLALGAAAAAREPDAFDALWQQVTTEDLITLI